MENSFAIDNQSVLSCNISKIDLLINPLIISLFSWRHCSPDHCAMKLIVFQADKYLRMPMVLGRPKRHIRGSDLKGGHNPINNHFDRICFLLMV